MLNKTMKIVSGATLTAVLAFGGALAANAAPATPSPQKSCLKVGGCYTLYPPSKCYADGAYHGESHGGGLYLYQKDKTTTVTVKGQKTKKVTYIVSIPNYFVWPGVAVGYVYKYC